MYILLITLILSAGIVLYVLPRLLLISLKNGILDKIDSRKIHTVRASRLGGVSFYPAIFIAIIIAYVIGDNFGFAGFEFSLSNEFLVLLCSSLALYMVGVYDDIMGVGYRKKFTFQAVAATMIVAAGCYVDDFNGLLFIGQVPDYVGVVISWLLIIFVINAINLIDGIDGLASMLSMMAFAMYGLMFYLCDDNLRCVLCVALFGALAPFWHHNVFGVRRGTTSKIFMGDGGAFLVGFILAILAIDLWNSSSLTGARNGYISDYSWVVAYTMLIIPCFDVLRVILYRLRIKQPLFKAGKHHFHHKLMAIGLSPRRSLVVLLVINALFIAINAALAVNHIDINIIVLIDVALWLAIHQVLTRKIKRIA